MKIFILIYIWFFSLNCFSQSNIKFNSSLFGDNITYQDGNYKEQKMGIAVYTVDGVARNTVIHLHGCGGPNNDYTIAWINRFKEWGYNAVVIDSYRYRGVGYACSNAKYLSERPYDRVNDLHVIADWISKQSWNKGKPAAAGYSHGAMVIHIASSSLYSKQSKKLLSSVSAFYPFCRNGISWDWEAELPLQLHLGEKDDFGPPELCKKEEVFLKKCPGNLPPWLCEVQEQTKSEKFDYNLYNDAYHGWDMGLNVIMDVLGVGNIVAPRTIKPNVIVDKISSEKTKAWFAKFFQ